MQQDFLKELANIGIGHAAMGLSKMINMNVEISLPKLTLVPIENLVAVKVSRICAITTGLEGDLKGLLALVFDDKTSFWIIDRISGHIDGTTKEFNEMGQEAMKEFCNIIGGAYLSALADFLQFSLMPKIPNILIGNGSEIKQQFLKIVTDESTQILSVKTELTIGDAKIDGDMHLILDKESFQRLFKQMN